MSAGPEIRIVAGDRLVGSLARLERLAESIFGTGERSPGWFGRKLARECVEPAASSLVVRSGVGDSVEPEQVVGYAMVGRPASLGGLARGAGVGLAAEFQGHGHGRALIDATLERAHELGCPAVEFLSAPERLDWYLEIGFECVRAEWTLLAEATGEHDRIEWGRTAEPRPDLAPDLWSWIPEAWQLTPPSERAWVGFEADAKSAHARAWVSREGRAVLVQRLATDVEPEPERVVEVLARLRGQAARGTPVLLHPCPAQDPWTRALVERGWAIAQRSFVVRARTHARR